MADRVRKYRGFSLLEMVVSVAILMILMAISAPYLMNAVYAMRLRYTAVDLSGLMQKARIDAVRKNTFYSIQQATVGRTLVGIQRAWSGQHRFPHADAVCFIQAPFPGNYGSSLSAGSSCFGQG